jgi:hypothetical protein
MEAAASSETLVFNQKAAWHNSLEDRCLKSVLWQILLFEQAVSVIIEEVQFELYLKWWVYWTDMSHNEIDFTTFGAA